MIKISHRSPQRHSLKIQNFIDIALDIYCNFSTCHYFRHYKFREMIGFRLLEMYAALSSNHVNDIRRDISGPVISVILWAK